MKLRLPLYARILGLFLLNILVITGAFLVAFRMQTSLGLDSFLAGQANQRVRALSDVVIRELHESSPEETDAVLARFAESFKLELYVFALNGEQLAGKTVALPREIERMLRRQAPGRIALPGEDPAPLRIPPAATPPEAMDPEPRPEPRLRRGNPDGERGFGPGPHGPEEAGRQFIAPGFFIKTTEPTRYWAGRFFVALQPTRSRPHLNVLFIVSDSITGHGLFFDFTPWIVAGCGGLLLSALMWLPFVRSITRSVGQMTRTTEEISVGRFEARVAGKRSDELGRLSEAINDMAGRLEGFVSGQRRFLGDIAHELCSPLARIQTALGILEQRADAKDQPYVQDLQEEAEHMSQLVSELLSFSKASMDRSKVVLGPISIAEVVANAARREQVEGVVIRQELPEGLKVVANAELLQRAVANLLRNAIRHAGSGGPITITTREEREHVTLAVADRGPGVPTESLPKLFDPFYRVDESRTRDTGGVGLGLTIVKTCVESCGGTVSATNQPEGGLRVELKLKRAH